MIIHLIASPRNVSTALMYSFSQHTDVYPIDEPFYACYLTESGKDHPDRELILQHQSMDRARVIDQIHEAAQKHPVVFVKNMAHHIREEDFNAMEDWHHCFLIRHPRLHIQSFAKVIPKPSLEDLGITTQRKLYDILKNRGLDAHVIDANQLLENPEQMLRRMCKKTDLPFQESMLSWPSDPKSYDGCWAPHWYQGVWETTRFGPVRNPDEVSLPEYLQPLLTECLIDYQYLYDQIKA